MPVTTPLFSPVPTPLQREASPKPAESVSRDDLRKQIITAIRDADNVEEVEEFFDVSKDDYLYVLDAIDEDEDKVICNATLLGTVGSIGIPYHFGQIRIQTNVHLLSAVGLTLGVPDMLMEYQDPDGDCIPLWATEISVSQTNESATRRLGSFMVNRKDLLAISLIDVKEQKKHAGPRSGLEAVEILEEPGHTVILVH
ncbi:hypothetical protein DFH29DRAFT_1018368 [Suillus ampliporus]|nr:hypothetical protein DFH29DRAFT_1018368 [Suillus ampliporus]